MNKLAPEYDGIELGIGETIIMKAIADSTGRTVEQIKLDYKSKGDLGLVAEVMQQITRIRLIVHFDYFHRLHGQHNGRCSSPNH